MQVRPCVVHSFSSVMWTLWMTFVVGLVVFAARTTHAQSTYATKVCQNTCIRVGEAGGSPTASMYTGTTMCATDTECSGACESRCDEQVSTDQRSTTASYCDRSPQACQFYCVNSNAALDAPNTTRLWLQVDSLNPTDTRCRPGTDTACISVCESKCRRLGHGWTCLAPSTPERIRRSVTGIAQPFPRCMPRSDPTGPTIRPQRCIDNPVPRSSVLSPAPIRCQFVCPGTVSVQFGASACSSEGATDTCTAECRRACGRDCPTGAASGPRCVRQEEHRCEFTCPGQSTDTRGTACRGASDTGTCNANCVAVCGSCPLTGPIGFQPPRCVPGLSERTSAPASTSREPRTSTSPRPRTYRLANPLGTVDPFVMLGRVIRLITGLAGSFALLMFVVGGVMWMTAADSDRVKSARDIIKNSSLGLLLIFFAYTLSNLLLSVLSGGS